jgi:hypothetical protein
LSTTRRGDKGEVSVRGLRGRFDDEGNVAASGVASTSPRSSSDCGDGNVRSEATV